MVREGEVKAERGLDRRFDVIVVGSGPGGATVAREMARYGKSVLLLERGGFGKPRDSLLYMASIINTVPVAEGVDFARGLAVGGTTNLWFGSAEYPPLADFEALGIDLGPALAEAQRELPIVEPASERLIGTQVRHVAKAARSLDVPWVETEAMAVDEARCKDGFSYEAIWRATSFVDDAVKNGATLLPRATARRVLVEDGCAVGVEYEHGSGRKREVRQAFAEQVVIAAGSAGTPMILRASGIGNVAAQGFYCDPGFLVMGHVKGLNGGDLFPGCMGTNLDDDGLLVGDGCLSRTFYRGLQLADRNWTGLFRHRDHVAVGVLIRDSRRGALGDDGRFHKEFTRQETQKLAKGEAAARRVLEKAGARSIRKSSVSAAHVGGTVCIGEVVDAELQTSVRNCYVCDNSVLPPNVRLAPVFTLVCLGKYLSGVLYRRL